MNNENTLYETTTYEINIIEALEQVMWDISDEGLSNAIQSQAQLMAACDVTDVDNDIH